MCNLHHAQTCTKSYATRRACVFMYIFANCRKYMDCCAHIIEETLKMHQMYFWNDRVLHLSLCSFVWLPADCIQCGPIFISALPFVPFFVSVYVICSPCCVPLHFDVKCMTISVSCTNCFWCTELSQWYRVVGQTPEPLDPKTDQFICYQNRPSYTTWFSANILILALMSV